jgi:hypothetical protein
MADQRRQNEQSQATPEIERRCFIQAGLAAAGDSACDFSLAQPNRIGCSSAANDEQRR